MQKHIFSHLTLEVCCTYWVLYQTLSVQQSIQSLVPIVIHCSVLLIKLAMLLRLPNVSIRFLNLMVMITLILHSISLGYLTLLKSVQISYIQIIILAQFTISYSHCNREMIAALLFTTIPLAFNYVSEQFIIEILSFSVLTLLLLLWTLQNKQNTISAPRMVSMRSPQAMPEEVDFKFDLINHIHKTYTWLLNEKYFIINENMSLISQRNMTFKEHLDDQLDIDESEDLLFQKFLDSKPETLSRQLQRLININISEISTRLQRTKNKLELRTIMQILTDNEDCKFSMMSMQDLDSKYFKFNMRFNIFVIADPEEQEENLFLFQMEQILDKRQATTKSYTTLYNNTNNQPSSLVSKTDTISSQMLSNIFSSISHEFGTHLNCILTVSTEGWKDAGIDIDIRSNYMGPISINAQLLQYILKNIRDFNSILLNTFSLRLQMFNPLELLREIVGLTDTQMQQRNIELVINCPPDLEIYNDGDRFQQVVYQLLSNAIRFTQNGKIEIDVHQHREKLIVNMTDTGIGMTEQEKTKLNELLRDNRRLIKVSQNSVGCGLGLSISNSIVLKMNNSRKGIQFTSNFKKGSSFTFQINNQQQLYNDSVYVSSQTYVKVLNSQGFYIHHEASDNGSHYRMSFSGVKFFDEPIEKQEKNELASRLKSTSSRKRSQETVNQFMQQATFPMNKFMDDDDDCNEIIESNINIPSLESKLKTDIVSHKVSGSCCKRVIVVDDEYFNISSMQLILKKFKIETDMAFNGNECIKMTEEKAKKPCRICRSKGYVLFFLDINMPVMDGIDTVVELKDRMKRKMIPKGLCIANSGYSDLETRYRAIQSGMDNYFTKPIRVQDLEKYIKDKFKLCI